MQFIQKLEIVLSAVPVMAESINSSNKCKNGDLVKIETSKNASPPLHWLSSSATGKARSAISRYWQDKSTEDTNLSNKTTRVLASK